MTGGGEIFETTIFLLFLLFFCFVCYWRSFSNVRARRCSFLEKRKKGMYIYINGLEWMCCENGVIQCDFIRLDEKKFENTSSSSSFPSDENSFLRISFSTR